MKIVALLSGGKDSCYNLVHCAQNGHELVAAASLGPGPGKEEIDSFMYQTVGQDVIEVVVQALDVPLFRGTIKGTAVEQGAEYGARAPAADPDTAGAGITGDETEDLYELLKTVKRHFPEVQGVSVGAILSNYQRVRVEHVCRRLSLTSLCYLWQRDQRELMAEMVEAGMEAIIIKVAGIGLTAKHLGKTLAEMQPTLNKLNDLYGSHICGEGGEYESLTLDCPIFKQRINLISTETVIHSDNDFASVAYLRIKEAALEAKEGFIARAVPAPPLLTEQGEEARNAIESNGHSEASECYQFTHLNIVQSEGASIKRIGRWIAIGNVEARTAENDMSLEDEIKACFAIVQDALAAHSLALSSIAHINLYISSIHDFARTNAVYSTMFGTSPPTRACVAVDLPNHTRVRMDCVAYEETSPHDRQALHVQSLSYWAPANIGPYSQAVVVDERVFISGQIGLVPAKMEMPSPKSLAIETALSFQHVDSVRQALTSNTGGGWEGATQGAICWLADSRYLEGVKAAWRVRVGAAKIPTLFVAAKELPKNALVETQVLVHTGRPLPVEDEDDEDLVYDTKPAFVDAQGDFQGVDTSFHWEASVFPNRNSSFAYIAVKGQDMNTVAGLLKADSGISSLCSRTLAIRSFHTSDAHLPRIRELCGALFDKPSITAVPSRVIATVNDSSWDFALCLFGV